jgi:hypothetical protein
MSRETIDLQSQTLIRVEMPTHLLQALRLVHALAESDYPVCSTAETLRRTAYLEKYFGVKLHESNGNEPLIKDFEIVHEKPLTRIGSIERPLIFPHAYFTYLRQLWDLGRDVDFSFIGLMTPKRIDALNEWLQSSDVAERIPQGTFARKFISLSEKLKKRLGLPSAQPRRLMFQTRYGTIMIASSDKGRVFPGKAWDDDYFRLLARSKFVLCPAGDYVWTYRFFESIMCGAIPIVEATCPSYKGFRYFTMKDPIGSIQWSSDIAEHNFVRCSALLTIPREELNQEISKMLPQD